MKANISIYRFNPNVDAEPYYKDYEFEYEDGENVLDALIQVQRQDPSVAFLYGCRDRHCGLCGVMMDGKAVLACKTSAKPGMRIEPLRGMTVIKDLVIDREELKARNETLQLFMMRGKEPESFPEKLIPSEFEEFKLASRCVECYCCTASCPVWQRNRHGFAGPTAFVLESRHLFDKRDVSNRMLLVKALGVDQCIECGACTRACAHKIDPCGLIKKLKEEK